MEMGEAAAKDIKECMLSLLETKKSINMIFAAAPSQKEVLYALATNACGIGQNLRAVTKTKKYGDELKVHLHIFGAGKRS